MKILEKDDIQQKAEIQKGEDVTTFEEKLVDLLRAGPPPTVSYIFFP